MIWLQIFFYLLGISVLLLGILLRDESLPWRFILYTDGDMTADHGYLKYYKEKTQPQVQFFPGNTESVVNPDVHTVAIVFNNAKPDLLKFAKTNIIGISLEPLAFSNLSKDNVEYISKNYDTYILSNASDYQLPFLSNYQFIPSLKVDNFRMYDKTSLISIMVSEKQILEGHKYRYELVDAILQSGLPIDIFGRGADKFKSRFPDDVRIKGEFKSDELYGAYKFTIAVENNRELNYISEKYTNALAYNTVPIYLGAPNLESIFGPNAAIFLTGNIREDIDLLETICKNPENYGLNLNFARKQLLVGGKANLFTFLAQKYAIPIKKIYDTVIVTGANDAYYTALKTQIASIHRHDVNYSVDQIIVLDLGLHMDHIEELKTFERVTVLNFPAERIRFSEQLHPKSYAWKYPFIVYVAEHFQCERIFWLDAGGCFMKSVEEVFQVIDKLGCLFVGSSHVNRSFIHTNAIKILGATEDELSSYQLCAGIAGYRTSSEYAKVFQETAYYSGVKACVFDMENKESSYKQQNIIAHRYDQSILSILVARYKYPIQDISIFGEFELKNATKEDSQAVIYIHRGSYQNLEGLKIVS
jgi:hypothetical protein